MRIIDQLRKKYPENGPWQYSHPHGAWIGVLWSVVIRSPLPQFEDQRSEPWYFRTDTQDRLIFCEDGRIKELGPEGESVFERWNE